MRREAKALFPLDDPPDIGPFYSSHAETATDGGRLLVQTVPKRQPKLGGRGENRHETQDAVDRISKSKEAERAGDDGRAEYDVTLGGSALVEANGPG